MGGEGKGWEGTGRGGEGKGGEGRVWKRRRGEGRKRRVPKVTPSKKS